MSHQEPSHEKVSPESLGLQAPMPKVDKFNKKSIFVALSLFMIIFIVSFFISSSKKVQDSPIYQQTQIDSNFVPDIPSEISQNKISYDSKYVTIPTLGAPRSGEVGEGIHQNHIETVALVHRDQLNMKESSPLQLEGIDENQDILKDVEREKLVQELELRKQALYSDLVLTTAAETIESSGMVKRLGSHAHQWEEPQTQRFDEYRNQNGQDSKRHFLEKNREGGGNNFNQEAIDSPYTVLSGTIIPCTLGAAIHSDLPGQITAIVRESVYDTMTGKHLLIPQGAKLIGEYNSQVSYGQERIQVIFTRILFPPTERYPNGYSAKLASFQGSDLSGQTGMSDKVNHHFGRVFAGAVLTSVLSAAATQSSGERGFPRTHREIMGENVGMEMYQLGQEVARKQLNRAPTITIRSGTLFNVSVAKDMILSPRLN